MWAYEELASNSWISLIKVSYLLVWTLYCKRTGTGATCQVVLLWLLSDQSWYKKSLSGGVTLVANCTPGKTTSHWDSCRFLKAKTNGTCFQIIPLYNSHWPFSWGLWGVVQLVAVPKLLKYLCSSLNKNENRQSEWIYEGILNTVNIWFRHSITTLDVIFGQVKAKRKHEYSSITVTM